MRRCVWIVVALAAACVCVRAYSAEVSEDPSTLVEQGNTAYAEKRYDDAATRYEAASHAAPESAEAKFDLGNARLKQGDLEAARRLYLDAYDRAVSDQLLRRRALYNLGNLAYLDAEAKLAKGDRAAARDLLAESVRMYERAAGEEEPQNDALADDARWNIQVARRRMQQLLDEMKKEQEQQQAQSQQKQDLRKKLDEAIKEQQQIADQTKQPNTTTEQREAARQRQQENAERTEQARQEAAKQAEQAAQQAEQKRGQEGEKQDEAKRLQDAQNALNESKEHQDKTAEQLSQGDMEKAQENAEKALDKLKEARKDLGDEQQQQQAQEDQQQEQDQQQKQNEQQAEKQKGQGEEQPPEEGEARELTKEEAQRLLEQLKRDQANAREARIHELERRGFRVRDKQRHEKVTRDW